MLYAYLTALLLAAMAPFHALACNHIGVIKADYSNFDDCENTCPGLVREPLCLQVCTTLIGDAVFASSMHMAM